MTDLDALERLLAVGPPLPLHKVIETEPGDYGSVLSHSLVGIATTDGSLLAGFCDIDADADLIVHAVNALPDLIARVRELEAALEAVRPYASHESWCAFRPTYPDGPATCTCGFDAALDKYGADLTPEAPDDR